LRVEPGASRRRRAQELEDLAEAAGREAEDRRQWAARHGLRSPHSRTDDETDDETGEKQVGGDQVGGKPASGTPDSNRVEGDAPPD
jgi:hypothetical protein